MSTSAGENTHREVSIGDKPRTLADVEQLHRRFKKTFGFAVTASQFERLLLLKSLESVGIEEVFEVLDANHDGRVDGLELLAALACVCRAMFEDKARYT
ncbi:hypothetical protein F442_19442 [Phytophthora nicotianae P10297]|uniref:EF-hand domain-containing protein n=1 Tax=Phytophthora nicotianae P10297 TaxID=1317064 RepID=W2YBZ8_PHYNI|nr:hypothetical protein F442_19442 [Phytophthora nicotianae P10297]